MRTGNVFGLFHIRSHKRHDGKPKVAYNTKKSAQCAAESMSRKHGVHFSNYKYLFCDGYHLRKNRTHQTYQQAPEDLKKVLES